MMSVIDPVDVDVKYDMDWALASLLSMLAPIAVFPKVVEAGVVVGVGVAVGLGVGVGVGVVVGVGVGVGVEPLSGVQPEKALVPKFMLLVQRLLPSDPLTTV